ncbi:hypothetical protein [Microbacterium sp. gxy059]|uniref:hypothetical protein n=1 Tax=Microbacterium sp. gxy059 TaxID=2957199 RepID=UPI003D99187A
MDEVLAWLPGALIVALVIIGIGVASGRKKSAPDGPLTVDSRAEIASLSGGERAEIDALLAAGQPIRAIRRLRELRGLSLEQAKGAIDRWEPGGVVASGLSDEATAEVDRLVREGKAIAAIKAYREHAGVGLVEAKRAIEAWPGYRPPPRS